MKAIPILLFSLFISLFLSAQDLSLLDKLSGGTVYDFAINQERERGYLLVEVKDSVWLNDQLVFIDTFDEQSGYDAHCFLWVNPNGSLNFSKNLGRSSGQLILNGSTIRLFTGFSLDTLFTSDTVIVKSGPTVSVNMVVFEYNYSGGLMGVKSWPATHVSRFGPSEAQMMNGDFYISGPYSHDTLTIDDQVAVTYLGTGQGDACVAKINSQYECEWIRTVGGPYSDGWSASATNGLGETLMTGSSAGSKMFCGGDSIVNPTPFVFGDIWVTKIANDGSCQWMAQGKGNSSFGTGTGFLSDGSGVVSGGYSGQAIDFGGIVVSPTLSSRASFIVKYSPEGVPQFASQINGMGYSSITSLAITESDAIWTTGIFYSGSIFFEPLGLTVNGDEENTFLIKYNQWGTPIFATSLWGAKDVSGLEIWAGPENRVYSAIKVRGGHVRTDGEYIELDSSKSQHTLIFELTDIVDPVSENQQGIKWAIYPNPLSKNQSLHFEITGDTEIKNHFFELFSIYGQALGRFAINSEVGEIALPGLPTGIYLLQMKNKEGDILGMNKLIVD